MGYPIPKYTIITKLRVYDDSRNWDDDEYAMKLYEEQTSKGKQLGLEPKNGEVILCHFFNSPFFDESTDEFCELDTAIQCLAIKDGVDLVQYSNGNYGYVAYYNGNRNGFEIIG